MIRLGSLAGYPFEGPRVLAGCTAPAMPAVYAILYLPDPAKQQYAVMYVGHSEDLSTEPFPFRHPRSPCWIERAGSKWKVFIATYEIPGGLASHRELIVRGAVRGLPAELQRAAVRPGLAGPLDRQLRGADHGPAQHRPPARHLPPPTRRRLSRDFRRSSREFCRLNLPIQPTEVPTQRGA